MRSLHHQGPQVTVAFLADVQLRFALAGISAPRAQPQKASHIPASAKSVRIVQGQNVSQRDQRPYTFHLFQPGHFGVIFLGDLLDLPIVFRDALVERFDFRQQRIQGIAELRAQPWRLFGPFVPCRTSSTARQTISSILARHSSAPSVFSPARPARGSPSGELRFRAPMTHWSQQARIDAGEPSQRPGVELIIFAVLSPISRTFRAWATITS